MEIDMKCTRCGGPAVRLVQTGELSCARQCTERAVDMANRMVLEEQVGLYARFLKQELPEGVGFVLVLCDFGHDGNLAYVSTVQREDSMALLRELLDKMATEPAVPTGPAPDKLERLAGIERAAKRAVELVGGKCRHCKAQPQHCNCFVGDLRRAVSRRAR